MKAKILLSKAKYLDQVSALHAKYRKALPVISNVNLKEKDFLADRMLKKQIIMLEAIYEFNDKTQEIVGFAHLYPSFSSVSMKRIFTINDIYIDSKSNDREIGQYLIQKADYLLASIGVKKIIIKTHYDRICKIAEREGYKLDPFIYYTKLLKTKENLENFQKHETKKDNIEINKINNLTPEIINLFDRYRMFYKQNTDELLCREFLIKRLNNHESIIFEAKYKESTVGFLQLYPGFSSQEMQLVYVLNDLYVEEPYRKLGIGALLIETAENYLIKKGITRISLKTAPDNPAKDLYEKLNYKEEKHFFYYYKDLVQNQTIDENDFLTIPEINFSRLENITITCD